jgi:ATP-dependent helicase/nuclease subunit A
VVPAPFTPRATAGSARKPPAAREAQALRRLQLPVAAWTAPAAARWDAPLDETDTPQVEFSWAGETARRVGMVAHGWLQRIAEEGVERWDVQRVRGLSKIFRANLAARGLGERDLDTAVENVERTLVNALEDERGRWILGTHREAHNEYRLTCVIGNRRRDFVLDRCFVDGDDVRWIVDYKTSRHEGADPDAFLDRERERYGAQLARYAALLPGPSRRGLYFPRMPGWRECE